MTTIECAALLFDMDGTLIDSTAVVEHAWGRFADAHDLDVTEILEYAHGRQTLDTIGRFAPHLTAQDAAAVAADLETTEFDDVIGIDQVPGAQRLLDSLGEDVPWAVVTSAPRALALGRMASARLAAVAHLVPADEIERGKPDPQGYERAAADLGVDPRDCVVFEDAEAGVRAGVAAGATVVVVGGLDVPATRGLHRVPDLTGVTVRRDGNRLVVEIEDGAGA